jgi:hypothetical protein
VDCIPSWAGVYIASNRRSPAESREDISSILPSAVADCIPESRDILLRLRIEPAPFRPLFVRHGVDAMA